MHTRAEGPKAAPQARPQREVTSALASREAELVCLCSVWAERLRVYS
jgi:hypothetical protein